LLIKVADNSYAVGLLRVIKEKVSFITSYADAIAAVRTSIYKEGIITSLFQNTDMINIPKSLFDQLTNLLTRTA
jgi:hypothetical protein